MEAGMDVIHDYSFVIRMEPDSDVRHGRVVSEVAAVPAPSHESDASEAKPVVHAAIEA
jgi:hypothetical protein